MSAYRETPEWRALETAVADLVRHDEAVGGKSMVADFTLVVYRVPEEQTTDVIGGYSHFSTTDMPHINQGLAEQAAGFWAGFGICSCGEDDEDHGG